jgi:hypothetical protein
MYRGSIGVKEYRCVGESVINDRYTIEIFPK